MGGYGGRIGSAISGNDPASSAAGTAAARTRSRVAMPQETSNGRAMHLPGTAGVPPAFLLLLSSFSIHRMRDRQRERRDLRLEALAVLEDHAVGALHGPHRGGEGAEAR